QGVHTHDRVTTASLRFSDWSIPFDVTQHVVHRPAWKPLAAASADRSYLRVPVEKPARGVDPSRNGFTVAVNEENVFNLWIQGNQTAQALVTRPCGRERQRRIELHDIDPASPAHRDRVIARTGVDVDDALAGVTRRLQTASQAVALVATDDDHSGMCST